MPNEVMAAGKMYRLRSGLCWRILSLRPRVARRFLQNGNSKLSSISYIATSSSYPHCMRTSVKKLTLWAVKKSSFVRFSGVAKLKIRDPKGTPRF